MNVFENPFIRNGADEYDVIRALVLHRSRTFNGIGEQILDRMGKSYLISQPEGILFKIVETHFKLKSQNLPNQEIFSLIEAQRTEFGSGIMPNPLDLESYVRYRLDIEQEPGLRVTQQFIRLAIPFCHMYLESLEERSKSEVPIDKIRCNICKKEKEEIDFLPIFLRNKIHICRSYDQSSAALRFFRAICIMFGMVLFFILAVYFLYVH